MFSEILARMERDMRHDVNVNMRGKTFGCCTVERGAVERVLRACMKIFT